MLGTVKAKIQLASASMLMLGVAQAAAGLAVVDNTPSKTEVGGDVVGTAIAKRGAVLAIILFKVGDLFSQIIKQQLSTFQYQLNH